jgi:hypothetical protein
MLLILNFHYLPLLCIVIKEQKKYSRSKFIQNRREEQQEQQKIERKNLGKKQKQTE